MKRTTKIIGSTTVYHGTEHLSLFGMVIRIIAVFKNGAADNDRLWLTDDSEIRDYGGVTADDRIEVQPWLEKEQRWSWVGYDPRAVDLDCFGYLNNVVKRAKKKNPNVK